MLTLSANWQTAIADTSAQPVWILEMPYSSGTLYLSDIAYAFSNWKSGITTTALIKSFDNVQYDIGDVLSAVKVSDLKLELINDPLATTTIESILNDETNPVEQYDVKLYFWMDSLNDAVDSPVQFWQGYVLDYEKTSELIYQVDFINKITKFNEVISNVISVYDYPRMDDSYHLSVAPIVFGEFENLEPIPVDVGYFTYLEEDLTEVETDVDVTDASVFAIGYTVMCELENMYVSNIVGNTLTVTRGYDSTTAAIHSPGEIVREKRSPVVYLLAAHALKSIDAIRLSNYKNITSDCTLYPNADLTGYEGYAAFTINPNTLRDHVGGDIASASLDVDGDGAKDDGSGTISGTPNLLLTRPDHVLEYIIENFITDSITLSVSSATSTYFDANDYDFKMIIDTEIDFYELLEDIGSQSRTLISYSGDTMYMNLKRDSGSSDKTLTEADILVKSDFSSTLSLERTSLNYIINYIRASYLNKYVVFRDNTSISTYGYRVGDYYVYDFVATDDMMTDIASYVLNFHKNRKKQITFDANYAHIDLQVGDIITMDHSDFTTAYGQYIITNAVLRPSEGTIKLEAMTI